LLGQSSTWPPVPSSSSVTPPLQTPPPPLPPPVPHASQLSEPVATSEHASAPGVGVGQHSSSFGGQLSGMMAGQLSGRGHRERDSALAMALEKSQDRIDALQRERDEALRRASEQQAEIARLTKLAERKDAEHRALYEDRHREIGELQRLRREHRDALEQLAALRAEAHQSRANSEEVRARFDRLLTDQREQIEALEQRTNREVAEQSGRTEELGGTLYACLQERMLLLQFLVDVLKTAQAVFNDAPSAGSAPLRSPSVPSRTRSRSCSCERGHRHSGCYACGTSVKQRREGIADLRELVLSLESEIHEMSQEYAMLLQRVSSEAELSSRVLGPVSTLGDYRAGFLAGDAPDPRSVMRTCLAWADQEHHRKERHGLPPDTPIPCINWAEERERYQAATRSLQTKFNQLAKLRRVLRARQGTV